MTINPLKLTIGQVEELWDEAFILEYPNRAAPVEMAASDENRAIRSLTGQT